MDNLKFRAWWYDDYASLVDGNYVGKWRLSPVHSIHLGKCSCMVTGGLCNSVQAMPIGDKCFIEQWSGLHDKKSKEIYKGDRCTVQTSDGRTTEAHVVYVDGCFELWFVSPVVIDGEYHTRYYLKCFMVNHAVEVIGTIHDQGGV